MSKTKKWLIAAAILVVLGLINCGVAFAAFGFSFNKLETKEYVTNTYKVTDDFTDINIVADTEKIDFMPSDDGQCKVVCVEEKDHPHIVKVEKNTLNVSMKPEVGIFNPGIGTQDMSITVYLPETAYGNVAIEGDTSDVNIPTGFCFEDINVTLDTGSTVCSASANKAVHFASETGAITIFGMNPDSLDVETDTGVIKISGIDGKFISLNSDTGNMTLSDIEADEMNLESDTGIVRFENCISRQLSVVTNTGNITFDECDAETIYATSDTGNITGTLLSDKNFVTQTDTGKVSVPASGTGGECEFITDTGNIEIEVIP